MKRSARTVASAMICFGSFAIGGCSAQAPLEATQSTREGMSGGTVDNGDLAVGLLFSHGTLADGGVIVKESCSGQLIAPDVILTAGHCFDTNVMDSFYVGQGVAIQGGDTNWDPATVNMKRYPIDQFVRPSTYQANTGCPPTVLDVAVAHLAQPVTGVTPLGLATAPPPAGAAVTTIGFGRHPTGTAPDPACLSACNGDCTCQSKCGCSSLQTLFGSTCLCTDTSGPYDQFVKRTATVAVAELLATTLHQTDVSQSTDLPGDSGGAVIYQGLIVGTDCCGDGQSNAQTDQYFARVDLAHDWIVGQIGVLSGATEGGAPPGGGEAGAPEGGSSGGGADSGFEDSGGIAQGTDSGGGAPSGDDAGGSPVIGGSGGGSSGGSTAGGSSSGGSAGNSDDAGGAGNGAPNGGETAAAPSSAGGCGCVAAGGDRSEHSRAWGALVVLGLLVTAKRRKTARSDAGR